MPEAWHTELAAAVRRQQHGFMRQMIELHKVNAVSAKQLSLEVGHYRQFLVAAASAEEELQVPSLQLDLVWHTHMLFPRRYARECVQIAGRLVNHDDS